MRVAENIINILAAAEVDGALLKLTGQLDRKTYQEVNKVIEAIGGKWNKKAGSHIFEGDASDVVETVVQTGEFSRTKQDFGQFDTPPALASHVADIAEILPGMDVLEPSAGIGNLVAEIITRGANVLAVEFDGVRCAKLKERFDVAGREYIFQAAHDEFLSCQPSATFFDRVLMNPPFAGQDDIRHVTHAFKFLKPGGRLVSIMSGSIGFRNNKAATDFRDFVAAHNGSIAPLPDGSFKESGTMVNTCVVAMEKAA